MKTRNIIFGLFAILLVLAIPNAYAAEIAYFEFENDFTDSLNSNDGTGNSVTFAAAVPTFNISGDGGSYSADFNADGDYISLADDTIGQSYTDVSVNYWVNFDNLPARVITLFDFVDTSDTNNRRLSHIGWVNTDSKTYHQFMSDGTDGNAGSDLSLATDTWYMISYVSDGGFIKTYKNGVLTHSTAKTGTVNLNTPSSLVIGNQDTGTATRGHDGLIDEFKVFDHALNQTELNNLFNCNNRTSCAAPPAPSTPVHAENLEQTAFLEQETPVTINGITYVPVYSSSVTISDNSNIYAVATVPINPTASNAAYCQITKDGAKFGNSNRTRSLTAGSLGNLIIVSENETVTAGTYDFGLECYRSGGGAFTVDNSSLMLHILTGTGGGELPYSVLIDSSLAVPLNSTTTLTTSGNYTDTGLVRNIILEWAATTYYGYGLPTDITITPVINGFDCSDIVRYGTTGTTGSVYGACYLDIGNETNSTVYTVGLTTASPEPLQYLYDIVLHAKEVISEPDNFANVSLTDASLFTSLNKTLTLNLTGHSSPNVIALAGVSAYSNGTSSTGTFYFSNTTANSNSITRTFTGGAGVVGAITRFSASPTISLLGTITGGLYFEGGDFIAYISDSVADTPNEFDVTVKSIYDASSINVFAINLSDGRSFTTTTGTVSVAGSGEFYNLTVSENGGASVPYFANFTLNHNSTADLVLNVTPYTIINVSGNATVSNFTVNGTSTTNGKVYLRLFDDSYNLSLTDADDDLGAEYADTNATVTASPYLEYYTFVPKYSNTINISFYDEETGALITPETVYLEAISESQSGNYTTTTGTITQNFLLPDTYTLRYNSLGYDDSFYYITIADRTFNALNLTLLNSSSSDQVTLTVYDTLGNKLESATVKVLKYNIDTNAYEITQILNTNFEGVAVANIVLNSEYYKFIIDYAGETRLTTTPTYIYGTTLTFYIPIGSLGMADYFDKALIRGTLAFNYDTNLATFTYTDLDNAATQGCLYAYTVTLGINTLVNTSCSSSSSGSLNLAVNNGSNSWYLKGTVTKGGEEHLISTYRVDFTPKLTESGSGAFFAFLLLTTIVFIGLFSLEIAVVIAAAVPLLFSITRLADIDYIISLPILLLGLVAAFIIGSNKQ